MDSAFDYIKDNGLAYEEDYQYQGLVSKCKNIPRRFKRLIGYVDINTCAELRESIFERSVVVAVDATNWSSYGNF